MAELARGPGKAILTLFANAGQTPRERQTRLFSATLDREVERLAGTHTDRPRRPAAALQRSPG
jgi:superfamily II DNA/RNA helicase